jgi:D-psicose/D-tagatose/L-ribulose 3-epimerase
MKYGVNTFIWTANFDSSNLYLLPLIKERGFDGVEVPLFVPADVAVEDIHRGLRENQLECTCCSVLTGGMNVISDDADVRRKTQTHLRDCAKVARELGAELIAGPLYSPVGYLPGRRRNENEWKWAVECYQAIGDTLDSYGVTIALEPLNRFETYFLNTTVDAMRLCDEIGHQRVGVLFDTFHANIEEKDVAAALRLAAPHLKHVHTCENDRGIPGTGHVDWPGVFRALSDSGYDGYLTIESFGFALGELSAAASIWRDIAPTPESIAFEGVEFLKRGMASQFATHGLDRES